MSIEVIRKEKEGNDEVIAIDDQYRYVFTVKEDNEVIFSRVHSSSHGDVVEKKGGYPPEVRDHLESKGYQIR